MPRGITQINVIAIRRSGIKDRFFSFLQCIRVKYKGIGEYSYACIRRAKLSAYLIQIKEIISLSRALFEYVEKISDKSEKELFNAMRNLYAGSHFSKETHHSSFDRSRYSGMENIKNIKYKNIYEVHL